jgi:CelD/BcsL family acetyltransferase involved in cellulose biosynthesis
VQLNCKIIDAEELSSRHIENWESIRRANPKLSAPSLSAEFFVQISRVVPNCKVVVLSSSGTIKGYMAFCFDAEVKKAFPIPMADYQPIVFERGATFDSRSIIHAIGLNSAEFRNVITEGLLFKKPVNEVTHNSQRVIIEASTGFNSYEHLAITPGFRKKLSYYARVIQNDHGPLSIEHGCKDRSMFARLMGHKADRYAPASGFPDFVYNSIEEFLQSESNLDTSISTLICGDKEVAWAVVQRLETSLFYWIPSFDPAFTKYSPGLLTIWLLLKDLNKLGCTTLDFGPGGENYKAKFANSALELRSAVIYVNPIATAIQRAGHGCMEFLRKTPIKRMLRG